MSDRRVIRSWRKAALCAVLVAQGCTHTLQPARDSLPEPSAIEYAAWLRNASATERAEELGRLEAGQPPLTPEMRSVRLALLLSLPGGSAANDARALELLAVLPGNGSQTDIEPGARQYRELGLLWREILEERAAREHDVKESEHAAARERERAQDLQEKNAALRKQIEALKSIEQHMNRREQSQVERR